MDNKVFNKVEEFIADKIKVNTAAIGVTTNSIDTAKANKEKAEKQAEKALNNANVDEYQKAHKAIEKADATIFVHSNLLNKLKEEPMISQAEYESMVSDIMAELAKVVSDHKKKVVALVDQIAAIGDEDAEVIKEGNAILKKLQHDLYRDEDCTVIRNGNKTHDHTRDKAFKDTDVNGYAVKIVSDSRYKKFGGTRKSNVNGMPMEQVMAYHLQNVTYHTR